MLKKLSSLLCILTFSLASYAQMSKNYIVVVGKKEFAIVKDGNNYPFDEMYLEYTIPDTVLTVLVIGDYKEYGDTVKTYRVVETFRKDGTSNMTVSQTNRNNDMLILNFTPYIHDSIYVSEMFFKNEE